MNYIRKNLKIFLLVSVLIASTSIIGGYIFLNSGISSEKCVEAPDAPLDLELFSPPSLLLVGDKAPEIVSPDVYNQNFSLLSLQGKVVLLNFMRTWCQSCVWEMGDLIDLHNIYANESIVFLSVAIEANGIADDVIDFKSKYCADWTFILDDTDIFSSYKVELLPTTFVIDKFGIIVYSKVGLIDSKELSNVLDDII